MTVWPNGSKSKPHVSSPFGPRNINVPNASKNHKGTDFSHTFTIIRAVEAGQVKVAGTPGGWSGGGIQVWVQHAGFFSKSLHAASLLVRNGQWVREGDPLCVMGETGTASDPHLHFEITPGNIHYSNTGQVDPVPFIANRLGSTAGGSTTEDDMPLTNDDLVKILEAKFTVPQGSQQKSVSIADALRAVYWYGDRVNALLETVPEEVWRHGLTHPLTKRPVPAGDLLRFEPAEHENTRRAVAAVATGDVDYDLIAAEIAKKFPQLDAHALAVAAADEADKRARERLGS